MVQVFNYLIRYLVRVDFINICVHVGINKYVSFYVLYILVALSINQYYQTRSCFIDVATNANSACSGGHRLKNI